jgi:hypothetical protein
MSRYITAQEIVNRVAVELGVATSENVDVFGSTDAKYVQLRNLLNTCGQDLVESFEWDYMRQEHNITTDAADSGAYSLPDDFGYMINQTSWERTDDNPVSGPLTPQQWQYLKGRDLSSSTIYLSFRIHENKFNIYPDNPVPDAQEIYFEYISRYWVISDGGSAPDQDTVQANGDTVLFKPVMIVQYLKYKFLDAKGFDTSSALAAFSKSYMNATGGNKGAPVLNAGRRPEGIPLLSFRNIPASNYGG